MFSHITIGTNDLDRAGRFYDALLLPLGLLQRPVTPDGGPPSLCWIKPGQTLPRLNIYLPFNGEPATPGNGMMVAFEAPSPVAVELSYKGGMAVGGTCEGAPGPRPRYGEGYFGAYLRDPDGNKLHVVFRGDIRR
jgi:catechol 2,3-dioxygenase-like lactoylglutathione lyase family enzyme